MVDKPVNKALFLGGRLGRGRLTSHYNLFSNSMGLKISHKWFFFMADAIVQLAIERSDCKVLSAVIHSESPEFNSINKC